MPTMRAQQRGPFRSTLVLRVESWEGWSEVCTPQVVMWHQQVRSVTFREGKIIFVDPPPPSSFRCLQFCFRKTRKRMWWRMIGIGYLQVNMLKDNEDSVFFKAVFKFHVPGSGGKILDNNNGVNSNMFTCFTWVLQHHPNHILKKKKKDETTYLLQLRNKNRPITRQDNMCVLILRRSL